MVILAVLVKQEELDRRVHQGASPLDRLGVSEDQFCENTIF